jgi:2-C-methyl-D-erythritol 2,4-cyclodiphosphate synthase
VIAGLAGIEPGRVSIKATTTEKLGFVGREEGVSAYAVVLIHRPGSKSVIYNQE